MIRSVLGSRRNMGGPLGSVGGGGGGPLFLDTFTDADNTLLTNHIPDVDTVGGGWVALLNSARILNNKAVRNVGNAFRLVADCGQADALVSCRITIDTGNNNQQGLLCRAADNNNMWLFVYSNFSTGSLLIVEQNGGTNTTRASLAGALTNGVTYLFEVALSGTSMEFFVDGVSKASYSSAFLASETSHGIQIGGSLNTEIDDFTCSLV